MSDEERHASVYKLYDAMGILVYVGVSTQYVVDTPVGPISVCVQGAGMQAPGERMELSFEPDATFVVSRPEGESA